MIKLSEIEIKDRDKEILAFLINPKSIAQVAAQFDLCYLAAQRKLAVWSAKEPSWIIGAKISQNRKLYRLNQAVIRL